MSNRQRYTALTTKLTVRAYVEAHHFFQNMLSFSCYKGEKVVSNLVTVWGCMIRKSDMQSSKLCAQMSTMLLGHTPFQSMMNAKLIQQRFWLCHENLQPLE